MSLLTKKTIVIILLLLGCVSAFASSESVTMYVGDTKTLYLPSSVTSKNIKSCYFVATSPSYADISSHTMFSVTVVAKKAISTPVIIRCDYTYYVLRNGKYVYGGTGFHDFNITVKNVPVSYISLPEAKTLKVGEALTLKPTISPSNATPELTWSSSNYSIVSVDNNGRIYAKTDGTAVITVRTSDGKSASCTVTAYSPTVDVTSVSVSPESLTLDIGSESTLTATVYPSNATTKTLSWASSNSSVATVTSSGKVKAVSEGRATIYATSNNGIQGSCIVTCKEPLPDLTLTDKQDMPSDIPAMANVTYQRTFYKGWNSLCVPFAVKASYVKGCKLMVLRDVEIHRRHKYFTFTKVNEVAAGTPCLVWVEKDTECDLQLKDQTLVANPVNTGIMKGSYSNAVIGAGCYKLTSDGESFSLTIGEDATVTAYRTYIKLQ